MSKYFKVLGKSINQLYINGSKVNLYNKKAIINLTDTSHWEVLRSQDIHAPYGFCLVYHDKVHIFGINGTSSETSCYHFIWDGTDLTASEDVNYLEYRLGFTAVVYKDEIHIFGGHTSAKSVQHYKWNDTDKEFVYVDKIPYNFKNGSAVVANNEIHLLGGDYSSTTKKLHYKWVDGKWSKDIALKGPVVGKTAAFILKNYVKTSDYYGEDLINYLTYDSKKQATYLYTTYKYVNTKGKEITEWYQIYHINNYNFHHTCIMGNEMHFIGGKDHIVYISKNGYTIDSYRRSVDMPYSVDADTDVILYYKEKLQYFADLSGNRGSIFGEDILYDLVIEDD